jgi:uncharacterized FlaG/YvyC family protein
VDRIPTFEKFNHSSFIKETYHLVEGHMSYDEYNELIGEGFFDFLKGLFTNPIQKRKLDKLGQDLLKTKIELMKLEIEEDAVNSFKAQLNQMTRGNTDYETTNIKIEVADRAKETKIKSLQDRELAIVDQMDVIGGTSDKLQKYVDKIKFEIRIKANDATIRIADDETERVLRELKARDIKAVKALDQELK